MTGAGRDESMPISSRTAHRLGAEPPAPSARAAANAEQLGLPEAAIVSRVRRAREVFRRTLAEDAQRYAAGKHGRDE